MYILMDSEQVRSLREEQGMSRRELAAAAGVSPKTARNAERGIPVMVSTAKKVARALEVDPPQSLGRVAR